MGTTFSPDRGTGDLSRYLCRLGQHPVRRGGRPEARKKCNLRFAVIGEGQRRGVMRIITAPTRLASLLGLFVFLWTAAYAQITPLGDAYINTADPTTNYGAKTLLDVDGATQTTYVQFNLGSIPTNASVSQATLKLYVNTVTKAGSFNVDYVNSAWLESTIDASNAPPLGAAIASNVSVTTADKNQYILINVTSAVQAWLSGSETNNGLALVANSTFNATFDSKENTTTSHAPELDIAFAGGDGTITGIATAGGSGLSGGGTTGTLSLKVPAAGITNAMLADSSITLNANTAGAITTPGAMTLGSTHTIGLKTCSANQLLQYNGTAWACASAGTGTVSSVGLSAPSSDFTVSGSPVTTSGTLGLNWTVTPTNLGTANAIVKRDAGGSFSAGAVVASLGVTG